jgi:hypothetical protein
MVLKFPYPLDYGEGSVLNQVLRILENKSLYPLDILLPPYIISNYPPVFILINALLMWFSGPNLLIGRIVVLISTIATSIVIAFLIKIFYPKQGFLPSLVGASVFLISPIVLQWSAYFKIDILALFFSVFGLYIVIKKWNNDNFILLATFLFILAAYTKQTFGLTAPLSAAIWIWTKDHLRAFKFITIYILLGLLIFGIIQIITHGGFYFHIISGNINAFYWSNIKYFANLIYLDMNWLFYFLIIYFLIGWKYFHSYQFLFPYSILSIIVAFTIGKTGSNVNYLLEICTALAILAGIVMGKVMEQHPNENKKFLNCCLLNNTKILSKKDDKNINFKFLLKSLFLTNLIFIIAIQIAKQTYISLTRPISIHYERIKKIEDFKQLEVNIVEKSNEGPVLVDEFGAILSINRIPMYIDPFTISQFNYPDKWGQSNFLQEIEKQSFPMILIHHFLDFTPYLERWKPEMLVAIFDNYVAKSFVANSLIFEPKNFEKETYPNNLVCYDAPWQIPSEANMGLYWYDGQLLMMGAGLPGEIPVYAVADGLLYQFSEWKTSVAIQHDDPFKPGNKVWSFYGDLAPAFNAEKSYILNDLRAGHGLKINKGDLIGFQGKWFGDSQEVWPHVRFTILPAEEDGSFPKSLLTIDDSSLELPATQELYNMTLNLSKPPSAYIGLPSSNVYGKMIFMSYQCDLN